MMQIFASIILLFAARGDAVLSRRDAQASKDSMITTIIEMLGKETDKITNDLSSEASEMEEYFGYCDDVQKELNYNIKTASTKISDSNAVIEDRSAQITALSEKIVELNTELAATQEDIDKANKRRAKQTKEFTEREAQQTIMVGELNKMEIALKEQFAAMTTPPPVLLQQDPSEEDDNSEEVEFVAPNQGYETFMQVDRSSTRRSTAAVSAYNQLQRTMKQMSHIADTMWSDAKSKRQLAQLQISQPYDNYRSEPLTGQEHVEVSAEAVEGQSTNTNANMAAFESLKAKAEGALQRERDLEAKKQAEHEKNVFALNTQVLLSEDDLADAKKDKNENSKEKSEAEGELATAQDSKAADEKSLKTLITECTGAAKAWETRQKEANDEMAAIKKAKEILASRVNVLLQTSSRHATMKPAEMKRTALIRQTLINHFRKIGQNLGSLSMLNLVSVASAQPLDKIMGLIKDMISKLQKEAAEAASQHEFCEAEKAKNEKAMKKATKKKEELDVALDSANSQKDDLQENIATLTEEIAEIDKNDAEAEKLRQEQHASFVKAEADFSEAADAVQDAISVLNDYYDSAFIQVSARTTSSRAPPKLGGAKQDSAGGIIGMLDTMAGEFTKTVAEVTATENEQAKAFEEMKKENFDSKTAKETEIIKSENEIGSLDITLGHTEEDKTLVVKELKAVEKYAEKLKPTCEGRVMSYAERKAKRDAEIVGLKEALAAIEDNTPTFLQVRSKIERN